jgi:hypothetical protein
MILEKSRSLLSILGKWFVNYDDVAFSLSLVNLENKEEKG